MTSTGYQALRLRTPSHDENTFLIILKTIGSAIAQILTSSISTITGLPSDISKTAELYFGDAKPNKDDAGAYLRGITVMVVLPYGLLVRYVMRSDGTELEESDV